MQQITIEDLKLGDIVYVEQTLADTTHCGVGLVVDLNYQLKGKNYILLWGCWQREEELERYRFSWRFDKNDKTVEIYRLANIKRKER